MNKQCAKCGSGKMMEDVQVFDQGQHSDGKLKLVVAEKPDAMLFKQNKLHAIKAQVCADCGFAELYLENPGEFYKSYRKSRSSQ